MSTSLTTAGGLTADGAEFPLAGDLRFLPPFELLPVLTDLGKAGLLRLRRSDGAEARCRVVRGCVADAEAGHLRGREAVLTFLWWADGRFDFEAGEPGPEGVEPIRVPELLMDAVRLADETERHKDAIPGRAQRPVLGGDAPPGEDELDCGIRTVHETLRKQPGLSLGDLERLLPLAPTKVRLSVALLVAGRMIRGLRIEPSGVFRRTAATSWQNVLVRYPGGVRVLVACCRAIGREQIEEAVDLLSASLTAPRPMATYAATGPSFVRMRPQDGGILSLTFLPTSRKNRYLFEAFARSVDAALFCSEGCPCGERGDWADAVPPRVRVVAMENPGALHRDLGRALVALGEARAPA